MNILLYFGTLVSLAIIDSVWLFSTSAYYKEKLGFLFATTPNFVPVLLFYPIYALAVLFFVILPAIKGNASLSTTLLKGAFFGFVAYATYDLTNNATLRDWPAIISVIDMAWGTILTGLVSVIVVAIYQHFK